MNSNDAFFSIRPTRRSNPECRTTLDALHRHHIHRIRTKHDNVDGIRANISTCDGNIMMGNTDTECSFWGL